MSTILVSATSMALAWHGIRRILHGSLDRFDVAHLNVDIVAHLLDIA